MRKFICCFALFCIAGSSAYAGPEPIPSGKEMKQVAPVPPACPQWTGFYAGAFGGYKFSNVDVDLSPNASITMFGEDLGPALESAGSQDLDNDGAEAGG